MATKALLLKADAGTLDREGVVSLRRQKRYQTDTIALIERLEASWWDAIGSSASEAARRAESEAYDAYNLEEAHFSVFMDTAREVLIQARIVLEEAETEPAKKATEQAINGAPPHTAPPGRGHGQDVRLPKLELPTFNGNPLEWQSFWQIFESAVDSQRIPNVQKINYLFSRLKDAAYRAVEGYAVTNDNYPLVVEALKNRFGADKVLTEALEAELINLPHANESVASLRATSEAIDRICRQFLQLGKDENSAMFLTTVKSKLPRNVLRELIKAERTTIIPWTMKDLRKELQDIIAIREEVGRCANAIKLQSKPIDDQP